MVFCQTNRRRESNNIIMAVGESRRNNIMADEYDFVEPPPEDYFCPVTYEIFKDPRQTSECCGKHLSREVAERLEREQKSCPLCTVAPLRTTADLYFKRRVLEVQVRCFNKHLGCEWKGDLGDVEKHMNIGCVEAAL
jgi:hypothetical protein